MKFQWLVPGKKYQWTNNKTNEIVTMTFNAAFMGMYEFTDTKGLQWVFTADNINEVKEI